MKLRNRRTASAAESSGADVPPAAPEPSVSRRGVLRKSRLPGDEGVGKYEPSIKLRSINGHITRTKDSVYAWYRLPTQRWNFRSDDERERLIEKIAAQYAAFAGRWLHLRVTARPYPAAAWAQEHTEDAPAILPDADGAPSYEDYIVGEQQAVIGAAMTEKEVYLGVQVQGRMFGDVFAETAEPVLSKLVPAAVDAERRSLESAIEHLDQTVAESGLEGRPVTAEEMSWLMYRSCGLGLPAPSWTPPTPSDVWGPEDLAGFTDGVAWYAGLGDPTATVKGVSGANAGVTRQVAVLSVGRMEPLQIPGGHDPWMFMADRVGQVEISARIYVCEHDAVYPKLTRKMGQIRAQIRHHVKDHGVDPPYSLDRQRKQVLDIEDEMASGFTDASARVRSWWRLAVSAETEGETLKLVRRLCDIYRPRIPIEHPWGQYALAREFIPGEPLASGVHQRRGSVLWAASAVPQAVASIGHRTGIRLGRTVGSSQVPFTWHTHAAMENPDGGRSGLTAITAQPGGGKSFLTGGIVYKSVRTGVHWDVLDPSEQLQELCDLPELAPWSRRVDLLDAEDGILNPNRMVPEPDFSEAQADANGDEDKTKRLYERRCANAASERRALVRDVLTGLLPFDMGRQPETRTVLTRAVTQVGGRYDSNPGRVIDELFRDQGDSGKHARAVGEYLEEMRQRIRLLIPEQDFDPYSRVRDDRLTVYTMRKLVLPRSDEQQFWTDEERLGMQLLNLAAWMVKRRVYTRPQHERKGVLLDEAFFFSRVPNGRALIDQFNRDSRKWNLRVLLSSQVPEDFTNIDGFETLLDSVFIGKLDGYETQSKALRMLKVPVGVGYESKIASLDSNRRTSGSDDVVPRHFLFADGSASVERILVEFAGEHLSGLRKALRMASAAGRQEAAAAALPRNGNGYSYLSGNGVHTESALDNTVPWQPSALSGEHS